VVAATPGLPAGRWGEVRLPDVEVDTTEESPVVHLGVDLFAAPGTAVRAPIAGSIVALRPDGLTLAVGTFELRLDGLRPATAPADASSPVGTALQPGTAVAPGSVLGSVDPDGLDGLPPHVHVQAVAAPGLDAPRRCVPSLAEAWRTLCPDPSSLLGFPAPDLAAPPPPDPASLLDRRDAVLAGVQVHYYDEPPQIERGWRHHLVDTRGRGYVDMVNNVAVLGHSHPAVEAAVSAALGRLNTNSRFLYEGMVAFAEALVARFPAPLDTVFLVNTGSEANELALRLAWTATGRRDVLAVRGAYHGWTSATDAISTSLLDNPDATATRPSWVHPVESPNTFRGRHRGPDAGQRYATDVRTVTERLMREGSGPAAFIAEPLYGNAGGIVLPDGYLRDVYATVREAGGLCIADEVQTGYGRLGAHRWAFEQQDVVPDIVTVAKAAGNGIAVGAVVTTRDIAEAFGAQGTFFSSVGGSPVACAAGLAVLDTIDAEGLQANALEVGTWLRDALAELADRHGIVGAVHGMGLYLGVELVRSRETLEPAADEALAICERMLDLGVVIQPTGDGNNVLKVKPPLCLTRASAAVVVAALDRTLTDGW
jgi:4-aminobutyrate aminotransferase-like enzyme